MPYLNVTDDAAELFLGAEGAELDEANPENRFAPEWLAKTKGLLDEAVAAKKPVVISATGKFFSNGLDLDYVGANAGALPAYLDDIHQLYVQVLTLPAPVIVAINGHAFGGGAMLALCADHRIMRSDRGFFSLPEAALGMPFTRGMAALVRTRTPDATATEAMLTSRRYGGQDAADAGIVDEAAPADALIERAREVARERAAFANDNLAVIKRGLRMPLVDDLNTPTPATLL
ncbi:enoyl-CoA hydratase/isomerase family protein [Gordonia zhaorongruii]|uniref:enoyl-CoA hydratase/isomerase family protein n=1 Tax=Gordonia zhaorongruii TaxID=2597659 RepID=UPI00104F660F|nr:enoyl-CoA hydratase/isomerase family protein [Gordonia zhaorongruii]